MRHFPDQMHIERIRDALWQGREFGKAAVMVGAGFSLNAKARLATASPFPTWAQLSEHLLAHLYPPAAFSDTDRDQALRQAGSTSGVLRIAQEYEAAFGRDALDSFLLQEIPDASFEPGHLHRLLLKLPWSDVLTTNYDTLLERATDDLVDRKYDVVRTVRDIPIATQPRIVKLHGSFPSVRPFIFTEEDFRTYPRCFAPFVNLAQQSIVENVFCLIGFSGDDPNFLYWTGWVRDNLGCSSPRIYLCGLLNLTTARRNMLHERNVVPIDLSPLFPPEQFPAPNRHAMALEWLLLNLEAGEPPSPLSWPEYAPTIRTPSSTVLPDVPGRECASEEDLPHWNHSDPEYIERLPSLLRSWKRSRAQYPGWLIAPSHLRDSVWRELEDLTLPRVLKVGPSLESAQKIEFLSQLNWWLELCLAPLWPDMAKMMSDVLEEINPFPGHLELPEASLLPDASNRESMDWPAMQEAWLELALALLRYSREEQELDVFEKWRSRLEGVVPKLPKSFSPIRYQECLLALSRMDHVKVRAVLADWDANDDDPVWLLRKAAVLGEIHDRPEARKLAEQALAITRRKLRPEIADIAMLSREGWAMALLCGLWWLDDGERPDFRGRWDRLTAYHCNPSPERKLLEARVEGPVPRESPKESESVQFDPGHVTRHFHFGERGLVGLLLPAGQAVRLTEDAGYPCVCGRVALSKSLLLNAARWFEAELPKRAMGILLRVADKKDIERFFSRHRIAAMTADDVKELYELLVSAVTHRLSVSSGAAVKDEREQAISLARQLSVPLELLSRLAPRLPGDAIEQELNRIVELYRASDIRFARVLASELKALMKRVFHAAEAEQLGRNLLRFMSLPIPGIDGFEVPIVQIWPEPAFILPTRTSPPERQEQNSEWKRCIEWLIEAATLEAEPTRSRAIQRLMRLRDWGLLHSDEERRFADAVWSHRSEYGLPQSTGLLDFSFLRLPEPTPGLARDLFKNHYMEVGPPPVQQQVAKEDGTIQMSIPWGDSAHRWFDEIVHATRRIGAVDDRVDQRSIDWTQEEIVRIFDKSERWWKEEGKQLCSEAISPFACAPVEARMQAMLDVLRVSVAPRCKHGDPMAGRVKDLLLDVEAAGFKVEGVLAALLPAFPDLRSELIERIRRGFVSQHHNESRAALQALYDWLEQRDLPEIASLPSDLIAELGSIISNRRQPAIRHALPVAAALVRDMPKDLGEPFVKAICVGLHYLMEETRYHASPQDTSATLPYAEIPHYRRKAAELAAALSESSLTVDPVVNRWLDAAASDPLPEVRRAVLQDQLIYDDDIE